jgi:hypothetical protein
MNIALLKPRSSQGVAMIIQLILPTALKPKLFVNHNCLSTEFVLKPWVVATMVIAQSALHEICAQLAPARQFNVLITALDKVIRM